MIDTFIAFTFLLVAVNLLLTVALVRVAGKVLLLSRDVETFLSGIRSVQVGLVEQTQDDETTHNEMRLH